MAQTTNSIWGGAAKIEISTNGTDWTDISGHANKVTPSANQRRQGQAYTFSGEDPIVKVGKKHPQSTRVDIVYTEQAADAYKVAQTAFQTTGGGTMYVRWAPGGGDSSEYRFSTGSGFVVEFQYPEVGAEIDGPVMAYFVVQSNAITQDTVPT
jgi:hypothetical protein